MMDYDSLFPVGVSIFMSVVSYFVTCDVISRIKPMFLKADLFGIDLCKKNKDKM